MANQTDGAREPPRNWVDALERAEADLGAGRVVDGGAIHAELRASIERMERATVPVPTRVVAAK